MLSKDNIKADFWKVISTHYEKECYTDALKDACLYIIQLVQEKSEQEDLDGEKLINNVFSESNPRLLINNNETQSEKDEQRGFGFLLRGIICAIRNPISHSRNFNFSKNEADAILLFINNYILAKLDSSKDFKYVEDWFSFIFEENDNDSEKFSNAILNNMSKKDKLNLLINVVNRLTEIKEGKYYYIINKLYADLNQKEQAEIINILNKKLIKAEDGRYLRMFFNHFNTDVWAKLDELIKVRIEEMVYNSIDKGKSYIDPRTMEKDYTGSLGTWTSRWIEKFNNSSGIIELIFKKMRCKEEADYVIVYFNNILTDRENLRTYSERVINGLKNGKEQYKEMLDTIMFFDDKEDELLGLFRDEYNNFKVKIEEDELPF